jgi:hypothetical protein
LLQHLEATRRLNELANAGSELAATKRLFSTFARVVILPAYDLRTTLSAWPRQMRRLGMPPGVQIALWTKYPRAT